MTTEKDVASPLKLQEATQPEESRLFLSTLNASVFGLPYQAVRCGRAIYSSLWVTIQDWRNDSYILCQPGKKGKFATPFCFTSFHQPAFKWPAPLALASPLIPRAHINNAHAHTRTHTNTLDTLSTSFPNTLRAVHVLSQQRPPFEWLSDFC